MPRKDVSSIETRMKREIYRMAKHRLENAKDAKKPMDHLLAGGAVVISVVLGAVAVTAPALAVGEKIVCVVLGIETGALAYLVTTTEGLVPSKAYRRLIAEVQTAEFFLQNLESLTDEKHALWVETDDEAYVLISEWKMTDEGWESEIEVMIFKLRKEGEDWKIEHFWDAEKVKVFEDGSIEVQNHNCAPKLLRLQ